MRDERWSNTLAEDNGWSDVIEQEDKPLETQEAQAEPVAEIPNEAIDRDILETPAEGELVEEDPDAWRTVRFEEDPGKIHRILMDASEKSDAVRRAVNNIGRLKYEQQFREREIELAEKLEAAEQRARASDLMAGNQFWGRMSEEQQIAYLVKNPQARPHYNNWIQLAQQMRNPQQASSPPAWVKNLVTDAQSLVSQHAPYLPEEYESQLRQLLADPQTFAQYKDRPYQLMADLKESIDSVISGGNNGGVQVDAAPRVPAPVSASARPRNESRVQASPANPAIGKFAPDATRRVGSSGGGQTYTRAEIAAMTPDEYGALRERHGAKTGQELYRRGIITD